MRRFGLRIPRDFEIGEGNGDMMNTMVEMKQLTTWLPRYETRKRVLYDDSDIFMISPLVVRSNGAG